MGNKCDQDIENVHEDLNRKNGYASVAAWIARDPDNETFVYRRFDKLSARNLLHFQSELLMLEQRIEELDQEVQKSKSLDMKEAARTWEVLVKQNEQGDSKAQESIKLLAELRTKLKEYRRHQTPRYSDLLLTVTDESLLLQSRIAKLDRPQQRVIDSFRIWFDGGPQNTVGEKPKPVLGGQAKYVLDNKQDLTCLKAPQDTDFLSRFLQRHWPVKVM